MEHALQEMVSVENALVVERVLPMVVRRIRLIYVLVIVLSSVARMVHAETPKALLVHASQLRPVPVNQIRRIFAVVATTFNVVPLVLPTMVRT